MVEVAKVDEAEKEVKLLTTEDMFFHINKKLKFMYRARLFVIRTTEMIKIKQESKMKELLKKKLAEEVQKKILDLKEKFLEEVRAMTD